MPPVSTENTHETSEAFAGPTYQDQQRQALRDLVGLAQDCASRGAAIEKRYRTDAEACARESESTRGDIEQRYQALKADIETRYAGFIEAIETQYQADIEKLESAEKSATQRVGSENANIEREVRQKLTQATWLAESVFEATQNQIAADARRSEEERAGRVQLIEAVERRTELLMATYAHPWEPPGEPESAEETPDSPQTPFTEVYEDAQHRLAALAELRLPKLFVGVLPFVVTLVLCAVAGIATQLVTGQPTPQWGPIGIAVAITLVVSIAAGFILRSQARAQLEQAARRMSDVILAARAGMKREYEQAARVRENRARESARIRDAELQKIHARYEPIVDRAARGRDASLQSIEEERARLIPRIEAQRQKGRQEADEWKRKAIADLEEGHQREVAARDERCQKQTATLEDTTADARRSLEQCWNEGLARVQSLLGDSAHFETRFPDWNDSAWTNWKPPREFESLVRFGALDVALPQVVGRLPDRLQLPERFSIPALLAFPRQASLLIHTDHAGRADAIRTLQTLMVRLLTSLPAGRVRFTIIDPTGLGQNFAGFMHLADYDESLVGSRIWTDEDHIDARLADLTEHMETVIQKYLRNEFETIDDYNAQAGELAEPYRFLVVADFPVNFTDIAVRRLNSIASTGARCGVYTLVARDTRQALPSGAHLDELEAHSVNLVREDGRFVWRDPVFKQFPLALDQPPSEDFLTRTLHIVGKEAKESRRVEVPFTAIAPPRERLWVRTTSDDLEVPIGRMGASRLQTLRLGHGVAQHVLLAGKTGSGKSTLLHVMVTNLALWYPPDEVEFYLVDFKKGVEFKAYAEHVLPHARAIAVESDREFGLSVLQRVDAELGRRGSLFRKAGVQDLAAYRQASGEKLPRTLLIIDEFQEFFSEDDKLAQDAGLLLDRLVRQGRAFGIHVLLGSQTIGGTSGLARSTLGQMAVRIALQTSEADSQIILGDGNSAARLLSRPGEAIYNDAGGLVEANSPFQVAWLPDSTRDHYLEMVRARSAAQGDGRPEAVVFEGNVPADITANHQLSAVIESGPTPASAAAPHVWLGEPVAIKDPTAVTLRRLSGANVLIVGQQDEAAMGLMASAMVSLSAEHAHDGARFVVLDGSPADSALAAVFPRLREVFPHEVQLVEYRAVEEAIQALGDEVHRRQAGADGNPPAVYVFVYGLQRYRALRRQEDSFSFSMSDEPKKPAADRVFAEILREGPPLGIHVIAWADTPAAVERTFDRSSLREFDNRVLFQMSAADSSNLIDSPMANKLGPNRALAYSEEQGTLEKFRPYAIPDSSWLANVQKRLHPDK